MKSVLAMLLVAGLMSSQAFAQSSLRADEKIKNLEEYRLGDSEDLQGDQLIVDHLKIEKELNQDANQHGKLKRLLKHHDMI